MKLEIGKFYYHKKLGIEEIFEIVELRENGFMAYDIWTSINYYKSGTKEDPWYCETLGEEFKEITPEEYPEYFI